MYVIKTRLARLRAINKTSMRSTTSHTMDRYVRSSIQPRLRRTLLARANYNNRSETPACEQRQESMQEIIQRGSRGFQISKVPDTQATSYKPPVLRTWYLGLMLLILLLLMSLTELAVYKLHDGESPIYRTQEVQNQNTTKRRELPKMKNDHLSTQDAMRIKLLKAGGSLIPGRYALKWDDTRIGKPVTRTFQSSELAHILKSTTQVIWPNSTFPPSNATNQVSWPNSKIPLYANFTNSNNTNTTLITVPPKNSSTGGTCYECEHGGHDQGYGGSNGGGGYNGGDDRGASGGGPGGGDPEGDYLGRTATITSHETAADLAAGKSTERGFKTLSGETIKGVPFIPTPPVVEIVTAAMSQVSEPRVYASSLQSARKDAAQALEKSHTSLHGSWPVVTLTPTKDTADGTILGADLVQLPATSGTAQQLMSTSLTGNREFESTPAPQHRPTLHVPLASEAKIAASQDTAASEQVAESKPHKPAETSGSVDQWMEVTSTKPSTHSITALPIVPTKVGSFVSHHNHVSLATSLLSGDTLEIASQEEYITMAAFPSREHGKYRTVMKRAYASQFATVLVDDFGRPSTTRAMAAVQAVLSVVLSGMDSISTDTFSYVLASSTSVLTGSGGRPTSTLTKYFPRIISVVTMEDDEGSPTKTVASLGPVFTLPTFQSEVPKPTDSPTNTTTSQHRLLQVYEITQGEYFLGRSFHYWPLSWAFHFGSLIAMQNCTSLFMHLLFHKKNGASVPHSLLFETKGAMTTLKAFSTLHNGQKVIRFTGALVLLSAVLVPASGEAIYINVVHGDHCKEGSGNAQNCAITLGVNPIAAQVTVAILAIMAAVLVAAAISLRNWNTSMRNESWNMVALAELSQDSSLRSLLSDIFESKGAITSKETLRIFGNNRYTVSSWGNCRQPTRRVVVLGDHAGSSERRRTEELDDSTIEEGGLSAPPKRPRMPTFILTITGRLLILFLLVGLAIHIADFPDFDILVTVSQTSWTVSQFSCGYYSPLLAS